jgi:hypothetical protein
MQSTADQAYFARILRQFQPAEPRRIVTRTSWKTGECLRRIRDLTHVLNPLDQRV